MIRFRSRIPIAMNSDPVSVRACVASSCTACPFTRAPPSAIFLHDQHLPSRLRSSLSYAHAKIPSPLTSPSSFPSGLLLPYSFWLEQLPPNAYKVRNVLHRWMISCPGADA